MIVKEGHSWAIPNLFMGVVLFAAFIWLAIYLWNPEPTMVGQPAYPFPCTSIDGRDNLLLNPTSVEKLTLCVFSPSCIHCAEMVPIWNMLPGEVVGVSLAPMGETGVFIAMTGLTIPTLLVDKTFIDLYHIESTPTTICLEGGTIKHFIIGKSDGDLETMMSFQAQAQAQTQAQEVP